MPAATTAIGEQVDAGAAYRSDAYEFSVLGPLEVVAADGPREIVGRKERALLAVLVASVGQPVAAERLIDALWGDQPPRSSAKVVQNLVLRLRKALGPELIRTRLGGYQLDVGPESVDLRRFERMAGDGRAGLRRGDPTAARDLAAALLLWRSSPLPELDDWPAVRAEIARLEELHRCVEEDLAEAELALGRHQEWIPRLETLVSEEPLRERRWGLLMVALHRGSRQADALRTYQRARAALADLGLEPGAELRAIERAVSAQDGSLDAPLPGSDERPLPTGVVTFLLTDVEGSSSLWERNPAAMPMVMERHDELIGRAVTDAGGVVLKARGEGDSTFCAFTKTSAAVHAALAARAALADQEWPGGLSLPVRMAIHTGEAHERDGDYLGPTVNRAGRLRGLASGGQVLLSEPVAVLMRDDLPEGWDLVELGEQALRGLTRPERVFTLVGSGSVVERGATLVARSCPYMGLGAGRRADHLGLRGPPAHRRPGDEDAGRRPDGRPAGAGLHHPPATRWARGAGGVPQLAR